MIKSATFTLSCVRKKTVQGIYFEFIFSTSFIEHIIPTYRTGGLKVYN